MELKSYQKEVLRDLEDFLNLINVGKQPKQAYEKFWNDKNVRVGLNGVPVYNDQIEGVPHICLKIPTGGGKTFVACNSLKKIFDNISSNKGKFVLWLVPSDSILEQTIKNLKNIEHPYRTKINADFNNRVEILTKKEILNGQNFNVSSVKEQLTVVILTFDTFRIKNKESRKIYQENGNLKGFTSIYDNPSTLVKDADETSLIQVINQLKPVVIVDESHNATSDLSIEMLKNVNPSFILDLTATPRENSNIISYVDALKLKKENMVKLPVIAYNRPDQREVIIDAIDLRNRLEKQAVQEEINNNKINPGSGVYIRPIVLFQAEPKNKEDSTTFEKIKQNLIKIGIKEEEIAIKTSEKNELKDIDLLSRECKIRYIITVNALKEGWDCPFAYILASLSNRTSKVDVEQILGRILRQPYATKNKSTYLNMSYVLTSSKQFKETLENIISGLNNAGFSKNDYRVPIVKETSENNININYINDLDIAQVDLEDLYIDSIKEELEKRENSYIEEIDYSNSNIELKEDDNIDTMLARAVNQGMEYELKVDEDTNPSINMALLDKMNIYKMKDEFVEDAKNIMIPQFSIETEPNLFGDTNILLTKEYLTDEFTLNSKELPTNLSSVVEDVYKFDIQSDYNGSNPTYNHLNRSDIAKFKQYISSVPESKKVVACKSALVNELGKIDYISIQEIRLYVDRIIDNMDADRLNDLENNLYAVAFKIKEFIKNLIEKHRMNRFNELYERGIIKAKYDYKFPDEITFLDGTSNIDKSLYLKEKDDLNGEEHKILNAICTLDNIVWWHRIISKDEKEFYINGFINHYPDFVFKTSKGRTIIVEVKGEHLKNEDSENKLLLGRKWQNMVGDKFRYYMVFLNEGFKKIEGSYDIASLCDILEDL